MAAQPDVPGEPPIRSPYLTAREAAAYLRISYGHFRNVATRIRRMPGNSRYRIEDLDAFAEGRSKRKQR